MGQEYANESYKNAPKKWLSGLNAIMMEQMVSHELGSGINGMATILLNIRKLITPIIKTAISLLDVKGNVNIKEVSSSSDGLWQTSIFVNTTTT